MVDVGKRTKINPSQAATIVGPSPTSIAFKGASAGGRRRHLAFPGISGSLPAHRVAKTKRNPTGKAAELAEAFHGDIRKIHRFPMPKIPNTAYEVGKLQAVIYQPPQWSKIGRVHRIHHFSKPRPRLIGFSSRPPWLIHGGRARFTSRGFID